ncbi:hypothetical protein [Flavivirga jejuensis]|uniref:FecR family protein n=1 Tax=Flavivirga jejuensis TaxID=870487 RepID=A0ABT8WT51_9FLAO|nr:hypothetical protein [Flavivirga jejuensis]MDO5976335.1 hypothetical protein [Flavivirga jejuensis]
MKITKELLKKYNQGKCTDAEKKEIELWLLVEDDHMTLSEEEFGDSIQNIKQKLHTTLFEHQSKSKVLPLYRTVMRYTAVACFIIAVFFAGRFSTTSNTSMAEAITEQQSNNLFVYGGDETHVKITGDVFSLQFNGSLKLNNDSKSKKTIKVGDNTYILIPKQTYYLMGNNHKSTLIADNTPHRSVPKIFSMLKGDFSIEPYIA